MNDEVKWIDNKASLLDVACTVGSTAILVNFDAVLTEVGAILGHLEDAQQEFSERGDPSEVIGLEEDIMTSFLDFLSALPELRDGPEWAGQMDEDRVAWLCSRLRQADQRIRQSRKRVLQCGSATGLILPAGYRERMAHLVRSEHLPLAWVHTYDPSRHEDVDL